MAPYDFGAKENAERYGLAGGIKAGSPPPSYREDFGLLAEAGVPIHFVAGGKDGLIPLANVQMQYELLRAVAPGLASIKVRETSG